MERLKAWGEQCALVGKTLEEVVEFGIGHFRAEAEKAVSPFASELLTLWVDDKATGLKKKLRPKTVKGIRSAANLMKIHFGDHRIAQIDKAKLEEWIEAEGISPQTAKNRRGYVQQFFNWVIPRYWQGGNPAANLEPISVERPTPGFYTVAQCARILQEAEKVEGLPPYIALCLFAGIRPAECERLTWQNIRFGTEEIWLPREITKTAGGRLFKMSDNLVKWLEAYRTQERLIPNVNMQNVARKIKPSLGFGWVHDGLRHTFATFHYATHRNIEQLRYMMGNSPAVIENFYKGEISQAEVEGFWNILPSPRSNAVHVLKAPASCPSPTPPSSPPATPLQNSSGSEHVH